MSQVKQRHSSLARASTRGLALIEFAIAAALGIAVLSGATYALRNLFSNERQYTQSIDFDALVESLMLTFSSRDLCNGAFVSADREQLVAIDHDPSLSNPVEVGAILMGSTKPGGAYEVANINAAPSAGGLKVQSLKIIQALDLGLDSSGKRNYLATLRLSASTGSGNSTQGTLVRDFFVPITTAPDQRIVECGAGGSSNTNFEGKMHQFVIDQSHMGAYGSYGSPNAPVDYPFADPSYKICVFAGFHYIPSAANTDVDTVTAREHWIVKTGSGFSLRSRVGLRNSHSKPHEAKVIIECLK
jgi:hypothetical protein